MNAKDLNNRKDFLGETYVSLGIALITGVLVSGQINTLTYWSLLFLGFVVLMIGAHVRFSKIGDYEFKNAMHIADAAFFIITSFTAVLTLNISKIGSFAIVIILLFYLFFTRKYNIYLV